MEASFRHLVWVQNTCLQKPRRQERRFQVTSNFCSCSGPEFQCQLTAARHSGARRADALFGSLWTLHAHSPTEIYPKRKRFSVCESWKKGGKPESAAPLRWSTPSRLTESPQLGKRAVHRRAQPAGPRAPPRRQPRTAHLQPGPALPTTIGQAFTRGPTPPSLTGTTSSQW